MPSTINAEIYPLWARSYGNATASAANWLASLLVTLTFGSLSDTLSHFGLFEP